MSAERGGGGAFRCDRIHPPCPTHSDADHRCDAERDTKAFGCGRVVPPCPGHDSRGDACPAGRWECNRIDPPCEGHRRAGLICGDHPELSTRLHPPILVGLNLPWTHHYCGYDFGGAPSGWRAAKPSPRDFEHEIGNHLRDAYDVGVRAIRVFLLADGVSYPENGSYDDYASHGLSPGEKGTKLELGKPGAPLPAPLSDDFVADVRGFLDVCHSIGLRVIPSFLSFEAFFPAQIVADGTVKHGRGVLALGNDRDADREHVERFYAATLDRLLAIDDGEGKPHPAVMAWEVMNEPDWCVRKGHVSAGALSRFLDMGVDRIVRAGYVASIGFVRADVEWLDPGLHDRLVSLARSGRYLHQVHYYPRAAEDRLPVTNATAFGDATIIGEMAINDTTRALWPDPAVRETESDPDRFLLGRLAYAADSGYRWAFFWSRNANDDKSGLDEQILRQLDAFAATNAARV